MQTSQLLMIFDGTHIRSVRITTILLAAAAFIPMVSWGQSPIVTDPTFRVFHCDDIPITAESLAPFSTTNKDSEKYQTHWVSLLAKPKFVAVVVHGLNLNPDKMNDISHVLQRFDGEVLQVALPGHRLIASDEASEPYVSWLGHLRASLCLAKSRATQMGVPLFFVGFSLGGALYEDLLAQKTDDSYKVDAAVLFAPAISLPLYAHLLRLLFIFGDDFSIPSWTPSSYRLYTGIKVKHYRSLFRLIDQLDFNANQELNLPTLVFIDPNDEMVSLSGIKRFIRQHQLSSWKIDEVSNQESLLENKFHHLIIGPESLGIRTWIEVRRKMMTHLYQAVGWEPPPHSFGF